MDSGLWPQSSAFSPADVVPIHYSATGILSEQLCNGIAEKKPFHLPTYNLWASPLSLLKHVFCQLGLRPSDKYQMTRSVPEERKQNKKRGLYILLAPAFHLEAPAMRDARSQARSKEGGWRMTELITNAAEPSPVHSTISEEWLHCETQDSALTFPEIRRRGLLRFIQMGQRHQPEEICDSGWINAKWAKYLKNQSLSCPLLSRPFLRRPCWAHV